MTEFSGKAGLKRRELFGLAAATVATAATSALAADAPQPARPNPVEMGPGVPIPTAIVETTSGRALGLVNDGVHTFKGLRYGEAPVGALRWMPPQKGEARRGDPRLAPITVRPRCSSSAGRPRRPRRCSAFR
jgi:para-nitrobenzyl esterase